MDKRSKIYIAGHNGMVGRALCRELNALGYKNLLVKSKQELDLTNSNQVQDFFTQQQPDYVFMAAAKVGGIHANNSYRADFIYQNTAIAANVIHYAHISKVKRLLFLGSTCVYPKESPQPIKEEYLLSGPLEQTNESYAIAKIVGIKMCQAYHDQYGSDFFSIMPTNLYGSFDNFNLKNAHVLPALIHKVHLAKQNQQKHITVWGDGTPLREFLHVDDLAKACVFLMQKNEINYNIINVGSNLETSIKDLVQVICRIIGYQGDIIYDSTKPNGAIRKLSDSSRVKKLGFKASINLEEGIKQTYQWFLDNQEKLKIG